MTVTATTLRLDLADRIHKVAVLEDYETRRTLTGPISQPLHTHTVLVAGSYLQSERGGETGDYLLKATVRAGDALVLRGFEPGDAEDFETALFDLESEDQTEHPLHRNMTVRHYRITEGKSLRSGPLMGTGQPRSTSVVLFQQHTAALVPMCMVGLFDRKAPGGETLHVLAYPGPGARTLVEMDVAAGDVIAVTPA